MSEVNTSHYQVVWWEESGKKVTVKDRTYPELKGAIHHAMELAEHNHISGVKVYVRKLKADIK